MPVFRKGELMLTRKEARDRAREKEYNNAMAILRMKDLWMIKTIYLIYLLKSLGVNVDWLLACKDKQAIYEAIERVGIERDKPDG